jgi:hypothetical protein
LLQLICGFGLWFEIDGEGTELLWMMNLLCADIIASSNQHHQTREAGNGENNSY